MAVDATVNRVPMIDLLIAAIAFLLVTAVWVQSGALRAEPPRSRTLDGPAQPPAPHRVLAVTVDGPRVGETAADAVFVPNGADQGDRLRALRTTRPGGDGREVWIQPDGAVAYDRIVHAMDTVYEAMGPRRRADGALSSPGRVRFM